MAATKSGPRGRGPPAVRQGSSAAPLGAARRGALSPAPSRQAAGGKAAWTAPAARGREPRGLFALVRTAGLVEREPQLRDQVGGGGDSEDDGLTAIEQEGLPHTSSLESILGRLAWPEEVDGVALAVERLVVPPEADRDLPEDPDLAAEVLAAHPDRKDVRLLVAVLRDGESTCLLRQRDHDTDDKVASGPDIAPGLVHALRATLQD